MKSFILAAGVAALAIAAPAAAGPDKDRGGGKDRVKVERVDRQAKAERVRPLKVERVRSAKVERVRPVKAERVAAKQAKAIERRAEALERRELKVARVADRRAAMDVLRIRDWDEWDNRGRAVGWTDGCPPGLAKKPVPCVPPGQVGKLKGLSIDDIDDALVLNSLPQRLRVIYPDNDDYYYRFGNGYVYQVDRETQLINALLPLFGLGVGVGQPFPASYSNYGLPTGLQPFYPDTPFSEYRYANGYVYQVDPITGLVEDVDPMLGYGYGYGQMMPLSYSAYNVPQQYRPYYADTSDYYYRYAPGAIYRVDSGSGLIDAVAALLTGGMTVGQPMPMGYDVYNVPMAYRGQYYDTPDAWYRYSNGYIYQVDPTTRLVTALVTALT